MIPDDTLNRQLSRFSTLSGFKAILEDPAEHKRAMKEAERDEQLDQAFTLLILQEGRRACPKPGEIVGAIRTIAQEEQMAEERPVDANAECFRCHNRGHFNLRMDGSGVEMPCTCARGRHWRELHPDLVAEYEAACDAAERAMDSRVPRPRRQQGQPGSTRTSQILGRDLR